MIAFERIKQLNISAMNKDNLFIALVSYSLRWCGLFGQNTFFGGKIGIFCLNIPLIVFLGDI